MNAQEMKTQIHHSARMKSRILAATFIMCLCTFAGGAAPLVTPERTAIFPEGKAAGLIKAVCYHGPEKITGYWTPAETDLATVENTLEEFLKSTEGAEKRNWAGHRRQIAGVKRGEEKFIFISYFPFDPAQEKELAKILDDFDANEWKKSPVGVLDGGRGYFRVLYDVAKKQFVWYECNGEA